MPVTGHCDLCGSDLGGGPGHLVAGLTLCEPCDCGDFGGRLVDRGIRVQSVGEAFYSSGGRGGGLSREVTGAIPYDLGLVGHFSKEDLLTRVSKIFSKELQIGDREFDDTLYIRTDDPDVLARDLEEEGLRAAILHAVRSIDSPLEIHGHRLTLDAVSIAIEDVPRTLRDLAVVLHHMESLARRRRLRRQPGLASYPDLDTTRANVTETSPLDQHPRFWPKGLFFQGSSLDGLDPIVELHDLMARKKNRPLAILRLKHSHLISDDLSPLARLTRLRVLELHEMPAARELPSLRTMASLEELTITDCPLTDLSALEGLPAITELWLQGTPVADLRPLAGLTTLTKLDLRSTRVTDPSPLMGMSGLKIVWVEGLAVDPRQLRELEAAVPGLELDPY